MNTINTTLIAVLGRRPQVVTFLLDSLLSRDEQIDRVVVLFPGRDAGCQRAYRLLSRAFSCGRYGDRRIMLRREKIRIGTRDLDGICGPSEIEAARKTIGDLFLRCKSEDDRIFLSISGGQRIMVPLATSMAMRHFTTEDRIWHIHIPDDLAEPAGNRGELHFPPGSQVQLIEVPIVPWAVYLPGLAPLLGSSNKNLRANGWLDAEEQARCRRVWESITSRQRDALREIAYGRSTKQAAERMGVAPSTVASHRGAVLYVCSEVWSGAEVKFDTQFLRERFRPFLVAN